MYKLKSHLIVLLLFCTIPVYSQYYPVSTLPDSLKTNATMVVRDESREVEMRSVNSGSQKITEIFTIFNKKGEDQAALTLYYDKSSTVKINEIVYYNARGSQIRSAKQSEITDSPAYQSSQLYSEARLKSYKPAYPDFPYTIKYTFEYDLNNIISLAVWYPVSKFNVSIQHSAFTLIHPADINMNVKEVRIKATISENNGTQIIKSWEVNNLKAMEMEPFDAGLAERVPSVFVTPSILSYDKYKGKADNWADYGKWVYSLYNGRDIVPEEEKSKVNSLLTGIKDTIDQIKAVYKYMQNRTRYVGITLGIGGYQPFDAKTVYETGYGDCKALSNYMFSLLKSIGIKSYPAIVSSGRYKEAIFHDFPNFQQFDHAILCVPYKKDTIWLECTDQRIPFGFLGDFTDDRDVLLITEQGGRFAHTWKYSVEENIKSSKSEIVLDSLGTATCSIRSLYSGLQYDDITELLYSEYDDQKKWLYENSTLPSEQIKSFSVTKQMGKVPCVRISENSVSKNYCSFSGKYMVLPLNALNVQPPVRKMLGKRESEILISRSYMNCDTVIYKLPKNYILESIPAGGEAKSEFGSYKWSVTASDKEIIYLRKFTIFEGHYKPSSYKDLYDFILLISKADNSKILLTKKT